MARKTGPALDGAGTASLLLTDDRVEYTRASIEHAQRLPVAW